MYVKTLPKDKQEENKQEMLARAEHLVYISPILEGFALKNKLWRMFLSDFDHPRQPC
jgi:hypothetical protein